MDPLEVDTPLPLFTAEKEWSRTLDFISDRRTKQKFRQGKMVRQMKRSVISERVHDINEVLVGINVKLCKNVQLLETRHVS